MGTQDTPDIETIRAAVAGEAWALEKVLASYDDEINRLATIRKRQPDGSIKAVVDEDMRQRLMAKRLEAIPHFPIEGE